MLPFTISGQASSKISGTPYSIGSPPVYEFKNQLVPTSNKQNKSNYS